LTILSGVVFSFLSVFVGVAHGFVIDFCRPAGSHSFSPNGLGNVGMPAGGVLFTWQAALSPAFGGPKSG